MWIETNQLGRRNLPDDSRAAIALSIMERRSKLEREEQLANARKAKADKKTSVSDTVSDTEKQSKEKAKPPKKDTRTAVAKEAKTEPPYCRVRSRRPCGAICSVS